MPVGIHPEIITDFENTDMSKETKSQIKDMTNLLNRSLECMEKISNLETKILNSESDDKPITDLNIIEVGNKVSIYGVTYLITEIHPLTIKLKKIDLTTKHVVPIKLKNKINILGMSFTVFNVSAQYITLKKISSL